MIHWCTCQIMTEAEHGRLTLLHRPLPEYIVHTVSLEHSMLWYGKTTSVLPTIHIFVAEIMLPICNCTKMLATLHDMHNGSYSKEKNIDYDFSSVSLGWFSIVNISSCHYSKIVSKCTKSAELCLEIKEWFACFSSNQ